MSWHPRTTEHPSHHLHDIQQLSFELAQAKNNAQYATNSSHHRDIPTSDHLPFSRMKHLISNQISRNIVLSQRYLLYPLKILHLTYGHLLETLLDHDTLDFLANCDNLEQPSLGLTISRD
ncbi:hypothetical protein BDV34DRAFT_217172 [Aspergillus parasiticus]|uniref:Uncharacterized protein n=1 Tax=Aspergillus parasiticus TaxID=5067 RepID=A0A5N6D5U9_ASPPA|nr:hypothetical protein BDV34DRAFT_217172 [Aspergillus parasiticus]